jgi:4-hydroxy-2-oxoheptanedioate aldolase
VFPVRNGKILRDRLAEGETVFGPFMKLASPQIVEIAGLAGFDFVILDTEHGPLSFETVENLVRAAEVVDIAPLVRVYDKNPSLIVRGLDVGAQGVLVPHISSVAEAESLAETARFAPHGERGVCRYVRAAEFSSLDRYAYFDKANRNTLVIAMIEGEDGIGNLDEILSVSGIDVVFIGPYDLSQSLGIPGQVTDPRVVEKMREVADAVRSRGKVVGTFVDNAEAARRWADLGVQFISISVDVGLVYNGMRDTVVALRGEHFED